jgi:hypothetical protein
VTPQAILGLWEEGQGRSPVERALLLLEAAAPGARREQLAALTVNERDARLLAFRERVFGTRLNAYAECPVCREALEFALTTGELKPCHHEVPSDDLLRLEEAGIEVRFRLPTSADLAAIEGCADLAAARGALLERCVSAVHSGGTPLTARELSEGLIERIAEQMAERAPEADVQIELACPACGHRWSAAFDIAAFLWAEIRARSGRLLREVAALARAYGWSEREILQMSALRRHCYLELAGT